MNRMVQQEAEIQNACLLHEPGEVHVGSQRFGRGLLEFCYSRRKILVVPFRDIGGIFQLSGAPARRKFELRVANGVQKHHFGNRNVVREVESAF